MSRLVMKTLDAMRIAKKSLLLSSQRFLSSASSTAVYPDIRAQQLRRGAGGRSSFNGQVVTVFGGGGFVGRYVVNKLAKTGTQVVVPFRGDFLDCQRLKSAGDLGQILFRHFHLKDAESVFRCVKYSTAVINLIGKDTETNNFSFRAVHEDGARLIAQMSKEAGVQRFVHLSAANASAQPQKRFLGRAAKWLQSKHAGEQAVREAFPSATIVRPTDIHGADESFPHYFAHWQRRQLGRLPLIDGGFQTQKQPVFVGDVAQAIVNALSDDEAVGQLFEAFGPRRYTMRALVEYIQRIIQKTPEDGFHVTNIRWAPLLLARIFIFSNPKWLYKYPNVSFEKLERV
ncbi:unnamed protein product, partial [Oppiella nova]